jgi:hypothetical protein
MKLKIVSVYFFLLFAFIYKVNGQEAFIGKSKSWIDEHLKEDWKYSESKISNSGDLYITYKNKKSTDEMSFYFDSYDNCNQVIISTYYSNLKSFKSYFDSIGTSLGFLKWSTNNNEIYVEFNIDYKYLDLLLITIESVNK